MAPKDQILIQSGRLRAKKGKAIVSRGGNKEKHNVGRKNPVNKAIQLSWDLRSLGKVRSSKRENAGKGLWARKQTGGGGGGGGWGGRVAQKKLGGRGVELARQLTYPARGPQRGRAIIHLWLLKKEMMPGGGRGVKFIR